MPIVGWICTRCGEVPLDHFQTSKCGLEVCHPDYANAVLKSRNEHYAQGIVEVSHGLGCPRSYAIQHHEGYRVNPLDMNAMETGTAWHAHLERASVDPKNSEVKLSGTIAGIRIVGKTDRLRPEHGVVEDAKHQNDFSAKYVAEGAKPAHVVQLSLYAELVSQAFGWRPAFGIVWYHWSGQGDKAMRAVRVELLPLDEALAHHPYECEFSVAQLLGQAASGKRWQDLPLAGETIVFGKKSMCDGYCPVAAIFKTAAYSAPF